VIVESLIQTVPETSNRQKLFDITMDEYIEFTDTVATGENLIKQTFL
jgi:hypothetical protein